jgi:AbrB family looped-hinge helix DNA binding protein
MTTTITIDENGQIRIPLEVNKELNFHNNEWVKVSVKSDHLVIIPTKDKLDEEYLAALIHDGILIDVESK